MGSLPYEITFNGKVYRADSVVTPPPTTPPSTEKVYVRVLHDYEIFLKQIYVDTSGQYYDPKKEWTWRLYLPEVYHIDGGVSTEITDVAQKLIATMNPNTTMKKLTVGLDYMRAFTNQLGNGFDTRGGLEPNQKVRLYNWFLQEDMTYPFPSHDKIRVVGGQTLYGYFGGDGWFYPDYLDPYNLPAWSELESMFWLYMRAISVGMNKTTRLPKFDDFNQGNGYPFLLPFMSRMPVRVPEQTLQVTAGWTDPMKVYIWS